MELEAGYEILNRDAFNNVSIEYTLTTLPSTKWTTVFNKRDTIATSIENTKNIIIIMPYSNFANKESYIENLLIEYILFVDEEIIYNEEKIAIILSEFLPGMIVLHSREHLSYNSNSVYNSIDPDYQYYVKLIKERKLITI